MKMNNGLVNRVQFLSKQSERQVGSLGERRRGEMQEESGSMLGQGVGEGQFRVSVISFFGIELFFVLGMFFLIFFFLRGEENQVKKEFFSLGLDGEIFWCKMFFGLMFYMVFFYSGREFGNEDGGQCVFLIQEVRVLVVIM